MFYKRPKEKKYLGEREREGKKVVVVNINKSK